MFLGYKDSRFLSPVVFSFFALSSFFSHSLQSSASGEPEVGAQAVTAKAVGTSEKDKQTPTVLPLQESTNALIFDAIARENLKTLTSLEVDLKASEHQTTQVYKKWHEVLRDTLKRHLSLATKEKRRLIFMLFSRHEKEHPLPFNTILDAISWQDLELLCGPKSDPSHYVASKIDRTVTEAGRAIFFKKIIEPTANVAVLTNNQAIVRELLDNEKLFEKFEKELARFQRAESAILSLWHEDAFHDAVKQDELNIPGAKKASRYVNKSPKLVEMNSYTRLGSFAAANAMMVAAAFVLPTIGVAKLKGYDLSNLFGPKLSSLVAEHGKDFRATAGWSFFGISFWAFHKFVSLEASTHNRMVGTEHVILGPLTGYPALFFPDYLRYLVTLRLCLQTKLIYTAQYIDSLKKIAVLIQKSPALKDRCPALANLSNELDDLGKTSADMKQLLDLLKTDTFKGKASFFSWYGRVNVAYQLLHEVKNLLIHPMMVVGELDAYMSCARFVKELQAQNIPVCFPTYITEQLDPKNKPEPALSIEEFWNPSIPGNKAVSNSLVIGCGNPKNIIVTGPNAGGKSTTMKGLLVNVVFAQTFGIATARSLTFTPFTKIITYLNITDDIAAGKSHFKAGACRAREVIKTALSVSENEFSLTAVDEVFNGTTFYEGQAAAYALIEQLSTYPNNICVTITHFPKVPLLAHEYKGVFANYKVTVSFGPNGEMSYPYKIEPGISHQNIALEILKTEGFNDTFLTKATQILAQNPEVKEIK